MHLTEKDFYNMGICKELSPADEAEIISTHIRHVLLDKPKFNEDWAFVYAIVPISKLHGESNVTD